VLTGFNTDIDSEGVTYHVQTEDRGGGNPLIESLVYVRGEILATRRTEYRNLIEAGADMTAIRTLMERQHKAIVDAIRTGRIDVLTEPSIGGEADTTVSRRPRGDGGRGSVGPVEAAKRSQRTLDEVIADWLADQQKADRIRILINGGDDLRFGATFKLLVSVRTTPGDGPVQHAHVVAKFLSTAMKAVKLAEAHSGAAGDAELAGTLPQVEKGTALVVVSVQHPSGNDEVKFLVKR
jgi:hypothetical protein